MIPIRPRKIIGAILIGLGVYFVTSQFNVSAPVYIALSTTIAVIFRDIIFP